MKRLRQDLLKEQSELIVALADKGAGLEDALEAYNTAVAVAFYRLQAAVEDYNLTARAAQEWLEQCAGEIQDYMAERSERWSTSEAGQTYEAWLNAFRDTQIKLVEYDAPEPLELPDCGYQDEVLSELAPAPEA